MSEADSVEAGADAEIQEETYLEFIRPYKDALRNLQVRIDVLNEDFRRREQNYPIHHVQERIKKKSSIESKLRKKGYIVSAEAAMDRLTDIAGIRVVCYLIKDIYVVVSLLKKQQDMVVIKETDYIKNPKENGYRSYHIVLGLPVYHTDGMQYFPVEVQLRTMGMDLWASMEHRICYKVKDQVREDAHHKFSDYSEKLRIMEEEMEYYLKENAC